MASVTCTMFSTWGPHRAPAASKSTVSGTALLGMRRQRMGQAKAMSAMIARDTRSVTIGALIFSGVAWLL